MKNICKVMLTILFCFGSQNLVIAMHGVEVKAPEGKETTSSAAKESSINKVTEANRAAKEKYLEDLRNSDTNKSYLDSHTEMKDSYESEIEKLKNDTAMDPVEKANKIEILEQQIEMTKGKTADQVLQARLDNINSVVDFNAPETLNQSGTTEINRSNSPDTVTATENENDLFATRDASPGKATTEKSQLSPEANEKLNTALGKLALEETRFDFSNKSDFTSFDNGNEIVCSFKCNEISKSGEAPSTLEADKTEFTVRIDRTTGKQTEVTTINRSGTNITKYDPATGNPIEKTTVNASKTIKNTATLDPATGNNIEINETMYDPDNNEIMQIRKQTYDPATGKLLSEEITDLSTGEKTINTYDPTTNSLLESRIEKDPLQKLKDKIKEYKRIQNEKAQLAIERGELSAVALILTDGMTLAADIMTKINDYAQTTLKNINSFSPTSAIIEAIGKINDFIATCIGEPTRAQMENKNVADAFAKRNQAQEDLNNLKNLRTQNPGVDSLVTTDNMSNTTTNSQGGHDFSQIKTTEVDISNNALALKQEALNKAQQNLTHAISSEQFQTSLGFRDSDILNQMDHVDNAKGNPITKDEMSLFN